MSLRAFQARSGPGVRGETTLRYKVSGNILDPTPAHPYQCGASAVSIGLLDEAFSLFPDQTTPKDVNNGEAPTAPCRDFALLDVDEAHLNRLGLRWETIVEVNRRWLLLHDYPLPAGYAVAHTKIALEIPPNYPGAQIYGFYAYPPLALFALSVIDTEGLHLRKNVASDRIGADRSRPILKGYMHRAVDSLRYVPIDAEC